ncbi:MAG: ribosome maturation factor RimM [Thermovirgaceae bacterium]|nr:ribosome maturation factor RimM [Thermovirgaceae bacterium]
MVIIGRVLGAHGVRGEIRILPLTDFPERFMDMDRIDIFRPAGKRIASLEVEEIRTHEGKGVLLIASKEIADRDAAQALEGGLVMVLQSQRASLPEGSYWIDDIIGLSVVLGETGETIGVVEDLLRTGEHDIYSVRTPDGKLKMLPAVKEVILRMAPDEGVIEVSLPEGLWD